MKHIPLTYTFDASAKQITSSSFDAIENIALITNITTGVIIYQFNSPTKGGVLAGSVLTLDYDTMAMSDTDKLQIIMDKNIVTPGNTPIQEDAEAIAVCARPAKVDRIGFTKTIANGVDSSWGAIVGSVGTGMAVNQTGGNLVITSGTTAKSETIIRSNDSFLGGIRLRIRNTLSQRITNNNFIVELVDVIGDLLPYNIISATQITVTFPASFGLSAENIGQSMSIGLFNGTGTFTQGRYPIASVSGNDARFTVSGFAVGSGTCSVFGWNFYRSLYDGTLATSAKFDTARNGYATGDSTLAINTTATPGHMAIITGNDMVATYADQVVATGTTIKQTVRGSRDENVPDDVELKLQIRVLNGTTAPASTTTWTIGMVSVTNFSPMSVNIQDLRPMGVGSALPVEIMRGVPLGTQPVSGTVTSNVAGATLAIPTPVADIASGALTTTTTTTAITPTAGMAYTVNIPVTAVSGTNPTLDISVEESDDTGTNYRRVYDFPRITATGFYSSLPILLQGNRLRYVQTVGGTTPSFTRAVNRLQRQDVNKVTHRQRIDRTIAINSISSAGVVLETQGSENIQLVIALSAGGTVAPAIQLQGSDDNINWYSVGTPLTATLGGTVQTNITGVSPKFVRPFVSTSGTGAVLNYILIKSF